MSASPNEAKQRGKTLRLWTGKAFGSLQQRRRLAFTIHNKHVALHCSKTVGSSQVLFEALVRLNSASLKVLRRKDSGGAEE